MFQILFTTLHPTPPHSGALLEKKTDLDKRSLGISDYSNGLNKPLVCRPSMLSKDPSDRNTFLDKVISHLGWPSQLWRMSLTHLCFLLSPFVAFITVLFLCSRMVFFPTMPPHHHLCLPPAWSSPWPTVAFPGRVWDRATRGWPCKTWTTDRYCLWHLKRRYIVEELYNHKF